VDGTGSGSCPTVGYGIVSVESSASIVRKQICMSFGNRVLRIKFGPKREEVAGCWRRLHNEELRNLYASSNVIRAIKLRKMRWRDGRDM